MSVFWTEEKGNDGQNYEFKYEMFPLSHRILLAAYRLKYI